MRAAVLFSAFSLIEADSCVACSSRRMNFTEWDALKSTDCWDDEKALQNSLDGKPNSVEPCRKSEISDHRRCATEIRNWWTPEGNQRVSVIRGCKRIPADLDDVDQDGCVNEIDTTGAHIRTCYALGRQPDDGEELREVPIQNVLDLLEEENLKNVKCHVCEGYTASEDGSYEECRDDTDQEEGECPEWASMGCFRVNNQALHEINGNEKRSVLRGCSAFSLDQTNCNEYVEGIFELGESCKDTCPGNEGQEFCNVGEVQPLNKCYVCDYEWDSLGTVRNGDVRCRYPATAGAFELQECPDSAPSCATEMKVLWNRDGNQINTISRFCTGDKAPEDETPENNCQSSKDLVSQESTKSCKTTCYELGCNDKNDIYKLFSVRNDTISCNSCYYDENRPESNNQDCASENGGEQTECEPFEDSGCFSAGNWLTKENTDGAIGEFFRGCSSFNFNEAVKGCHEEVIVTGSGSRQLNTYCRDHCETGDCNTEPIENPGILGGIKCTTCSAAMNNRGEMISGSEKCFSSKAEDIEQFSLNCDAPEGMVAFCGNEMDGDWFYTGQQIFLVGRGCRYFPEGSNGYGRCEEYNANGYEIRQCSEAKRGSTENVANADLSFLLSNFESGEELSCYHCAENLGSDNPELCENGGEVNTKCPSWASTSCSDSRITGFSAETGAGYHKGCSTFDKFDEPVCDIANTDYEICRKTCKGNNCNSKPIPPPPQCHVCTYEFDDFGHSIGNPNCFNETTLTSDTIQTCAEGETVCVTELQSEWRFGGEQRHIIRRYCAKESALGEPYCLEHNGGEESYKDCYSTCSNDVENAGSIACNNNNDDVYSLFKPQGNDPIVTSCKSCFYSEIPNGEDGVIRCKNQPGDQDKVNCLPFQQAGCYVSNSWRNTDGQEYQEVYRGCSAFPESLVDKGCYESSGPNGAIEVCKSWCGKNQCNVDQADELTSTTTTPTTTTTTTPTTTTPSTTASTSTPVETTTTTTTPDETTSAAVTNFLASLLLATLCFL
ncbi:Oidioi.mRNA.OKI2018_I69.XSR.g14398.t1.cds [Oikopleura dioica]|uniref:Oidioi.mRNA.OKI2018_I69.XSR.g14398.t1.cds n=1 Tax=Oikopleura dioica TaxID=34765 RepID=A0ABN7S9N3_OIKDI|nr:Oidioi.mRNA.OKI2018_I69.XSR.g14398.t1.cds [Oikopleura dioica]